jgi:hypothetical protein
MRRNQKMPLPEYDKNTPHEEQGLYQKYEVYRTDGQDAPGCKHHGCDLFVLDLTHDPFALKAIKAYAEACKGKYPELAKDLKAKALEGDVEQNPEKYQWMHDMHHRDKR